ncbi:MAG: serine/threonine protein kinase [Deltaproteobacteria bacterium]|nr:serine/threonine protein kinase [Deltaproteobacteria bacterium]
MAGGLALMGFLVRLVGRVPQVQLIQHGVEAAGGLAVVTAAVVAVPKPNLQDNLRYAFGIGVFVSVAGVFGYHDVLELSPTQLSARASLVGLVLLTWALLVPSPRKQLLVLIGVCAAYLPVGALLGLAVGAYGATPWPAVLGSAVMGALPTWVACGVAAVVGVEQARRRQQMDDMVGEVAQLGSYTLESKIGEGGMGEVWRVQHAFLARPAAMKVIRAKALVGSAATPEEAAERARVMMTRFEREAQTTAQLTSPHTVQVYDFGRAANETFFYVMELLDGMDLWSLVYRFGPQPEGRVLHILLQACDSVGEAHARGLIHRDLKPANIFLSKQGMQHDVTKVLDFGLVKSPAALRGEQTETQMRLTQHGMVSGTPAYMSPEQASGRRDLDGRSDLYGLGCVAYFLLTGAEIFDDPNPIQIMLGQIERPPIPMRQRYPGLKLSPEFEAILGRMLEKNRDARFPDAGALADALRGCRLPEPWGPSEAAAWWSRVEHRRPAPRPKPQLETEEGPLPTGERRLLRSLRRPAGE